VAKAPSKRQLEVLRGLCAATGERYYRPKTSRQAQARIQLLAGIKKGTIKVRRLDASNETAKPEHPSSFDLLPDLFARLKRAHYTLARRRDDGKPDRDWPEQIDQLERQIDAIVEAPHG
jgi:hypothetical protein